MQKEQRNRTGVYASMPQFEDDVIERNGKRTAYAIARFEEEGIRYIKPSKDGDRFIVFSKDNGRKYQFYAGTGLILGPYENRGIENMILIAKGEHAR